MCQAAIIWAGIPEVVFGTSIATLKELGWEQFHLRAIDVEKRAAFAECQIVGGVLAEQCDQLFKEAKA
jgi:tRNA(Arg) A34 adenosine deaminase TadA